MVTIHEQFNMQGVHYAEIHFKVTPLAKDLIIHYFRDGLEISKSAYEAGKSEYKKIWLAANR
jgi:hypothetical protein